MSTQITYYQNKLRYEIDPADLFQALEAQENLVPVDARRSFAYERERIPQAINLPQAELTAKNTSHLDRTKTYICYCDGIGCNASTKAALKMTQLGFQVKELIGGIAWWKIDGYATQGSHPQPGDSLHCAC